MAGHRRRGPEGRKSEPREVRKLRARLAEAEETLRAIRAGDVDAVVVAGPGGDFVYTLRGEDHAYRLLVEEMQEGALHVGAEGQILYANRRVGEMLRLPLDRVFGTSLLSAVTPATRGEIQAILADGQGRADCELLLADDSTRPVRITVNAVGIDDVIGRVVVVTDLSEQKRHETIAAEKGLAEAENRSKDEFLAMLAHELRNPLAGIMSAVGVLDRVGGTADNAVRSREIIKRQASHLARLMDDLLDVARVTTGNILLTVRAVDLGDLAERCVSTFRSTGRLDAHEIEVRAVRVWVQGDPTRLDQVVGNLLTNAVKYTPAGGTIRVSVGTEDGQAVLRVQDTGVGIAPELLPRVFDLFVQGVRTDHTQPGLGLGLTLVRRLVDLHGGSVEARSGGAGAGTEITVRLPHLEARAVPGSAEGEELAGVPGEPLRVLLVEDDADAREALRLMLELDGHEVHQAASGESGVETAVRFAPDVILVDLGLPGIDGYEVARRLRNRSWEKEPRLVALTGYGQESDRRRSAEAGFETHLVKPVESQALVRIVRGA
jgi:signal transduction histidine kinase/CheY-like chemotaxis protein